MNKQSSRRKPSRLRVTANRLRLVILLSALSVAGLAITQGYHSPELWAFLGLLAAALLSDQDPLR